MRSNLDLVHTAVLKHDRAALQRAIQLGHDVDGRDREGRTALFYAVKDGESELTLLLLSAGSDVNARDTRMLTPLHFSAEHYRPALARLLIENGATVDAQDVNGNTPLSTAVFESRGRAEVIKVLRDAGANTDLENHHGMSPLGLARSIANYDLVKFLT